MKRPCLTLIELIVVIAIIAILLAITFPAIRSSKKQAKTAICGSNIKQLLIIMTLYENEYEKLPYGLDDERTDEPPGDYFGKYYDRMGWWWFNQMEGFESAKIRKTVLQCPAKNLKKRELKNNILCGNYGVNQFICKSIAGLSNQIEYGFVGTPLSCDDIPHPGRTLLIVDSGYSMINWWHACDIPPVALDGNTIEETTYVPGLRINAGRNLWLGQQEDAIKGRHPNKTVNVGYADCHVSTEKADDLLVESTNDGYENRSPLWLPE